MRHLPTAALALLLIAAPALPGAAQMAAPGAPDPARVIAGTYTIDPNHSQVAWTLNHLGFNVYHGIFGNPSGTLALDPAKPAAAKLTVTFPIGKVVTTSDKLNEHLMKPDFFDVAKYPTATFTATHITVSGTSAKIAGTLTLHGVTKPLTLDARFTGAGTGMMNKKLTVGFEATGTLNRSDYGMGMGVPAVGDRVDLLVTAAFEKTG